ncbi:DUF456 domain-containing protein [Tumebacillus permanentifrigoris]|uniref:DUF456 family protein n=1 Tax=Tumebacillus permanentifrigoris TaxID=378543 RepID=A0A316DCG8_9BACL|nr:DUF456 family protein [Tumebacillus permanentifrigoris]PWK15645.1 hypothetical protein C7459_103185 [Tumebacillus permanentifrigoris]
MDLFLQSTAIILASLFMMAALFFTVVPILPGTLFVIPGFLIYGWMVDWDHFSWVFWVGQILLIIVNFLSDNVAQIFGVKKMGGSKGGMIGGSLGMFILPLVISPLGPLAILFGPLLGAVLGAMVGEMLMRRKSHEVVKVGWGSLLSFLAGTVFKVLLVGIQIVWFYLAIF